MNKSFSSNFFVGILMSVSILIPCTVAHASFSGSGSGALSDPYQITSCAQFEEITNDNGASYLLKNDMDCTSVGNAISVTRKLIGVFDGAGHKITIATTNGMGLFDRAEQNAVIKNVWVTGTISGNTNGAFGFTGSAVDIIFNPATVSQVKSTVVITSDSHGVGGIVGGMTGGSIQDSYFNGSISGSGDNQIVGGIVGSELGTVQNSYSKGMITATGSNDSIGGIWGSGDTVHSNSIATNDFSVMVLGATGSSEVIGGLFGVVTGTVTNSFFDITATGQLNCGGSGSVSGCTGINSDASQNDYFKNSNAAGPLGTWDFTNTWEIASGGYPGLRAIENNNYFITRWTTTTPNAVVTIPTYSGDTYNYDVDWGDGNVNTGETGDATHTYTTAGTYTVSISGIFPHIYFGKNGVTNTDKLEIGSIVQWGTNHWDSMDSAFLSCSNLTMSAVDVPDLSGVTSTSRMFSNARAFNGAIGNWNFSTVINTSHMFQNARSFNQNISNWNVTNVTDMSDMFQSAVLFNQDISGWSVGSVTNMFQMFFAATAFNQNLNSWDVSHVTNMIWMFNGAHSFNGGIGGWNVSGVTRMDGMFLSATSFNQDLSGWDISNVAIISEMFWGATNFNNGDTGNDQTHPLLWGSKTGNVILMSNMFRNAVSFNQDINGWDVHTVQSMDDMFNGAALFNQSLSSWNVGRVNNMSGMFSGDIAFDQDLSSWNISSVTDMTNIFSDDTLSTTHYDSLLSAWSQESVQSAVPFNGGNSTYCNAQAARGVLTGSPNSWTITDGGISCPPPQVPTPNINIVSAAVTTGGCPFEYGWNSQKMKCIPVLRLALTSSLSPVSSPIQTVSVSGYKFPRTLKQGMKGDDVVVLQRFLKITPTDYKYFGSQTKSALMSYQKSHGLNPDGVAGSKTLLKINN
jgi:surface protein